MTSCDATPLRIRRPADLLDAVPYLLGFHPKQSLVIVGFQLSGSAGRTGRVSVTARADLCRDDLDLLPLGSLSATLRRAASEAAVALIFCDGLAGDPREDHWLASLASGVADGLSEHGITLLDTLVATDDRWWSMLCTDPGCCPGAGLPRAGTSEVAAAAVYSGLTALPSRASLADTLAGQPAEVRDRLLPSLDRASQRLAELTVRQGPAQTWRAEARAVLRAARQGAPEAGAEALSPRRLARYGAALLHVQVRDALWTAVDDGTIRPDRLLCQLHERLPAPYDAAPMFLYGWRQWRAGNGALAIMAAERALASDPGYSAARLLLEAMDQGLDPRTTPTLCGELPGSGHG